MALCYPLASKPEQRQQGARIPGSSLIEGLCTLYVYIECRFASRGRPVFSLLLLLLSRTSEHEEYPMAPAAAADLACLNLVQSAFSAKVPPESYRHMKSRARKQKNMARITHQMFHTSSLIRTSLQVYVRSKSCHPAACSRSRHVFRYHLGQTFVRRRVEAGVKSPRAGTLDLSSCSAP